MVHPNSVDLWKFKLMLAIDAEKSKEEIEIIFNKSLECVKEKVISIRVLKMFLLI